MNRPRIHHRPHGDGDGWVTCRLGHRHWGRYGAAGLLLTFDGKVLLQHRAEWSHQGGTWSVPGGARSSHEDVLSAALREAHEEARVPPDVVAPLATYIEDHHSWSYTTVVAITARWFEPARGDAESLDLEWVQFGDVGRRPLHPAFLAAWPVLRGLLDRRVVVVVDAANVVGSVPDGWWRDRAGATERLRDRLSRLATRGMAAEVLPAVGAPAEALPGTDAAAETLPATAAPPGGTSPEPGVPTGTFNRVGWFWPKLVLITEGEARSVGPVQGVEVVPAQRDGDSAITEFVDRYRRRNPNHPVFVVTADRRLRTRVIELSAQPIPPAALLDLLQ